MSTISVFEIHFVLFFVVYCHDCYLGHYTSIITFKSWYPFLFCAADFYVWILSNLILSYLWVTLWQTGINDFQIPNIWQILKCFWSVLCLDVLDGRMNFLSLTFSIWEVFCWGRIDIGISTENKAHIMAALNMMYEREFFFLYWNGLYLNGSCYLSIDVFFDN